MSTAQNQLAAIDQTAQIAEQLTWEAHEVLAEVRFPLSIPFDAEVEEHAEQRITDFFADPTRADQVHQALSYLEALLDMTAKEIARQQARSRAIDEAHRIITREALTAMETAGLTSVEGRSVSLRKRLNPPSVRIESPTFIPDCCMR